MPFKKGKLNYSCLHKVWCAGLTKETDNRLRKMSEDRVGSKNPMYGKPAWNRGKDFVPFKICKICNKKFEGRTGQVYCSRRCQSIGRKGKLRKPPKECPVCHKLYVRRRQKYCSRRCAYIAMIGQKRTLESRLKQTESRVGKYRGEKAPNWKGGVQRGKPKGDWRYYEWRKGVFERDNFTCKECNQKGIYLEAHHIKNWRYNPELRYDINNGITLCKRCHNKTKGHEEMLEIKFRKLLEGH